MAEEGTWADGADAAASPSKASAAQPALTLEAVTKRFGTFVAVDEVSVSIAPGERLHVTCTDPLAGIDVPNLIRETGDVLEEQKQDGFRISFLIRKAGLSQ